MDWLFCYYKEYNKKTLNYTKNNTTISNISYKRQVFIILANEAASGHYQVLTHKVAT